MDERQEFLITSLCEILLTDKDFLDIQMGNSYIEGLTKEDFELVQSIRNDNKNEIHNLLFYLVTQYIQAYQDAEQTRRESLFAFYGEGSFNSFRENFKTSYITKRPDDFPFLYTYIFDYIQELCEHYRIFQNFYNVSTKEMKSSILKDVKQTATDASNEAIKQSMEEAVKDAAKKIDIIVSEQTKRAEDQARAAKNEAEMAKEQAKNAAENAVNKEMNRVSSKVSETSVTILGIFAAIVLTAVTGLFYSSSVLESVNSANMFRLICIVSFVGLVSYHIVSLLFRCIERITDKNKKMADFNKRDWIVTIVLIAFIIGGIILQFVFPTSDNNCSKNSSSVNASEVIKDTTTETSTNADTTTLSESNTTNFEENNAKN